MPLVSDDERIGTRRFGGMNGVRSHGRLGGRALDSGGFTKLSTFGTWRTSAAEYVEAVAPPLRAAKIRPA